MKPFNLEEALKGASLITRNGKYKNVKIIKVDLKNECYPLFSNRNDENYTLKGKFIIDSPESELDLFMQEDSDLKNETHIINIENIPDVNHIKENQNIKITLDLNKDEIENMASYFRSMLSGLYQANVYNKPENNIRTHKQILRIRSLLKKLNGKDPLDEMI